MRKNMSRLRIVLATLVMMLAFSLCANAADVLQFNATKISVTFNKSTISAKDINMFSGYGVKKIVLGEKVKKIKKNSFKGSGITTVVVKTKKLTKSKVKDSLKGSKVKTIQLNVGNKKSNKKYAEKYKKIFTKKNAGKANVSVKIIGQTDTAKKKAKTKSKKWVDTKDAYTELNKYRKKAGVASLKRDESLEKVAMIRAEEIAKYNKFSHTRPNGKSGLTLIKGRMYMGENIAMGQTSCAQVTRDWYNSQGHRENMLRKQFKNVGIACYKHNGIKYWVQSFSS